MVCHALLPMFVPAGRPFSPPPKLMFVSVSKMLPPLSSLCAPLLPSFDGETDRQKSANFDFETDRALKSSFVVFRRVSRGDEWKKGTRMTI